MLEKIISIKIKEKTVSMINEKEKIMEKKRALKAH